MEKKRNATNEESKSKMLVLPLMILLPLVFVKETSRLLFFFHPYICITIVEAEGRTEKSRKVDFDLILICISNVITDLLTSIPFPRHN